MLKATKLIKNRGSMKDCHSQEESRDTLPLNIMQFLDGVLKQKKKKKKF